jgi:hypothetical protein
MHKVALCLNSWTELFRPFGAHQQEAEVEIHPTGGRGERPEYQFSTQIVENACKTESKLHLVLHSPGSLADR